MWARAARGLSGFSWQAECQTPGTENKRVIKRAHQVTGNFYRPEEVPLWSDGFYGIRVSSKHRDGNHFAGTLTIDQYDESGNNLAHIQGVITGTRITVDILTESIVYDLLSAIRPSPRPASEPAVKGRPAGTPGWSLALIGNASVGNAVAKLYRCFRGISDKETRRKPLARRTR
jgi:hypothetical protein